MLNEAYESLGEEPRVKIFASDVHRESLEHAGRGVYQSEILTGLTADQQERYFEEKIDGYHASPELRKMVVFVPHNVIHNAPFTNLDLITCRNLFIYLTSTTQKKVLSLFHFGLKTGGCLCLGSSETPGELSHEFEAIDDKCRIYRKHRDISLPVSMRMPFASAPVALAKVNVPDLDSKQPIGVRNLMGSYDLLLAKYIPPALLVSAERELLHVFGEGSRYLRVPTGRPPNNVLDLFNPALRTAVSATLRRTSVDCPAISHATLEASDEYPAEHIKITAEILGETDDRILICFDSGEPRTVTPGKTIELGEIEATSIEYETLERELQRTQTSLQATIEDAQVTTEELQAANEQLTASNEELQSTNEELHSVNEELYTPRAAYFFTRWRIRSVETWPAGRRA